jgi:hypothetical protein
MGSKDAGVRDLDCYGLLVVVADGTSLTYRWTDEKDLEFGEMAVIHDLDS